MDEGTEPSTIDIEFAYDSMFVETNMDMSRQAVEDRSKLGKRFMRNKTSG